MRPVTRKGFTDWLSEQDDLTTGRCPLDHYLDCRIGVTVYYEDVDDFSLRHDLPRWAVRLIHDIDRGDVVFWLDRNGTYSARRVEQVLAGIPDDPVSLPVRIPVEKLIEVPVELLVKRLVEMRLAA